MIGSLCFYEHYYFSGNCAYRQISDKKLTKTNYIACIYVINDRTT